MSVETKIASSVSWSCHCGCGRRWTVYVRDLTDPDHLKGMAAKIEKKGGGLRPDVVVECKSSDLPS